MLVNRVASFGDTQVCFGVLFGELQFMSSYLLQSYVKIYCHLASGIAQVYLLYLKKCWRWSMIMYQCSFENVSCSLKLIFWTWFLCTSSQCGFTTTMFFKVQTRSTKWTGTGDITAYCRCYEQVRCMEKKTPKASIRSMGTPVWTKHWKCTKLKRDTQCTLKALLAC